MGNNDIFGISALMVNNDKNNGDNKITTLIFDVDDTLYDVATGFTAHRNGEAAQQFMVDYLNFPTLEAAKQVRDEYFERYHATAKALTVAEQEGKFPPPKPGSQPQSPRFQTQQLAEYWATRLKFDMLGGAKTQLAHDLKECPLTLVAFSNGPRAYVKRVLQTLGLFDLFGEERLFAVDDVLPYCKPDAQAFQIIFDKLGCRPDQCIIVEDSMKNIRRAKALGVGTVLITGKTRVDDDSLGLRIFPNDAPDTGDPDVDVSMEIIQDFRKLLPGLWQTPAVFEAAGK